MGRPLKSRILTTCPEIEGLMALRMVNACLRQVKSDVYQWKWAIIAIDNALQAFLVANLAGTDGLGVHPEEEVKKWLKAYDAGQEPPPPLKNLDPLPTLLKKAQGSAMKQFIHSHPLQLSSEAKGAIRATHELRNEFVHFHPMTWSLHTHKLPRYFVEVVRAIEFLAFESGNMIFYQDGTEAEVREELHICYGLLDKLQVAHRSA